MLPARANETESNTDAKITTRAAVHADANRAAFQRVSELLEKGVTDGVYPGAVLLVGQSGQTVYKNHVGHKWVQPPEGVTNEMTRDTVFDIAGLTSLVVTSTILMKFVETSRVKLEDKLSRYMQSFGTFGKSKISIEQLLSHSSGLPAWTPYFEELVKLNAGERIGILTSRGARDYIANAINREELKSLPGTKQVYSDLGFLLLGALIEQLTGLSLDKAAQKYVLQPLGMKTSSYVDLAKIRRRGIHPVKNRIAPTELCPWRKRVLCGEVHDDNAWAMGGMAGHSGLFSDASDLHIFATEILRAFRGQSDFVKRETVVRFFNGPKTIEPETGYRLGWESPNKENNMLESKLSELAVGQCGFTGCSLWLEPTRGLDVILLSNRVHPSRSNKQIRQFRVRLHNAILEALA